MFRKFFSHEIKKVNFIFTSGSLSRTNIESWCHLYHTLSSHIAIKCSCADIFFKIQQMLGRTSNTTLQILSVKRARGGGTPQIRNPLFAERGLPPKSVTYFFAPKSGVF